MRNKMGLTIIVLLALGLMGACSTPEPTATPAPEVEAGPAALVIKGLVAQEQNLTMDDLKGYEVITITAEHSKKGQDEYEGVRLNVLLDEAGVQDGATTLAFVADDGYSVEVPLADVQGCADCLVSFRTQGGLRTVMPGLPSNTWVKGVISVEAK